MFHANAIYAGARIAMDMCTFGVDFQEGRCHTSRSYFVALHLHFVKQIPMHQPKPSASKLWNFFSIS